jgi:CheY-like chemotaxis protein
VITAGSGREAGAWLEKTAIHDWPDALVCDIAMPDEDGYATLKRIRKLEEKRRKRGAARLPAIALTAFTERKDRVRALAEGFQMHVTKPVAPVELIVVVSSVARGMQV